MTQLVLPRILIVDDHPLAREGLRAILTSAGYDLVGDAATGEDAVELARTLQPDIVLMDVRLGPGIDGLEATRRITALGMPIRVLMLTLHDMPAYIRQALAAGAAGYVLKDTAIDDLRQAITQVLAGQIAVPASLLGAAMRDEMPVARAAPLTTMLTERERGVLDQVAHGLTNKEIGRVLGISPATVKAHVERIIVKLGVVDRTQAAVFAARYWPAERKR